MPLRIPSSEGVSSGGSNPFEVPLPFAYNNKREASYGSASSFGTLAGAGAAGGTIFGGSSTLSVVPETQVFRFAQTTASPSFSSGGTFGGRSVLDVASDLRSGILSPSQVPVNYVQRGGINLIDNTRSSIALQEAGVPMSQWNLVNKTGSLRVETAITDKLVRNGLTNTGTNTVRMNGCTYFCQ